MCTSTWHTTLSSAVATCGSPSNQAFPAVPLPSSRSSSPFPYPYLTCGHLPLRVPLSFTFGSPLSCIVSVVNLFVSELLSFLLAVFSNSDWLSSEILHKAFPLSKASKPYLTRTQPSARGVLVNYGRGQNRRGVYAPFAPLW